jgi:hypothetical protein
MTPFIFLFFRVSAHPRNKNTQKNALTTDYSALWLLTPPGALIMSFET